MAEGAVVFYHVWEIQKYYSIARKTWFVLVDFKANRHDQNQKVKGILKT